MDDKEEKLRTAPGEVNKGNDKEKTGDQTVTIELVRHRQIFNILRNPKSLWKFLGLLIVVIVLLFFVLAAVSLIIKRYYPYNEINTNLYGATTLKNEEKDVTYWLFNTAELWANSGIEVQENDIVTIRTSGSWHTAINRLVEDCESNNLPVEAWIGSDGGLKGSPNDEFRSEFRISPKDINGILLMGVFPEKSQNTRSMNFKDSESGYSGNFIEAIDSMAYDMYPIGRERANIRILSKGILHFTVNDVVLTRRNIRRMYMEYVERLPKGLLDESDRSAIKNTIKEAEKTNKIDYKVLESINSKFHCSDSVISRNGSTKEFPRVIKFGPYAGRDTDTMLINELLYYHDNNFIDAWYVDNLGSALVIIEIKRQDSK